MPPSVPKASSPRLPPQRDKSWLGERYDAGAGPQYLNARYYDPELAVLAQPDWFEVMQPGVSTKRHAYAAGDLINHLDPWGSACWSDWGDFKAALSDHVIAGGLLGSKSKLLGKATKIAD